MIPLYVAIASNSGDKDFWGLFDFHLRSSTSRSTPSFSRRLFSSDKEGLAWEISDSRHFWKTRLRIFIVQPPGQHEEGEGVSKVRFVLGLHHRGNIRVRLLVRPDMSSYMVTFSMQTTLLAPTVHRGSVLLTKVTINVKDGRLILFLILLDFVWV